MRVLVTGATGFVGNNIVRLLCERGENVRVLARAPFDPRAFADLNVEVIAGDVCDAESVRPAMQGCDVAIHAAGNRHLGWRHFAEQRRSNVVGTANVAEAALAAGAKLIHVSSVDALGIGNRAQPANEETPIIGNTPCGYVITKQEAEQVVLTCVTRGLHGVIVNPGFMLGPWDWKPSSGQMLLSIAKGFLPLAPKGGCSLCDVRDVAIGILAAIDRGVIGRRYILAGENLTYLALWKLLAKVSGGRPPWTTSGPMQRFVAGRFGDLWGWLSGREPIVNSASVAMSSLFHYYCSDRAEQELGYHCRPSEITVRDAWNWFDQHGYV